MIEAREEYEANMKKRQVPGDLTELADIYTRYKAAEAELNALRRERNAQGQNAARREAAHLREVVRAREAEVEALEATLLRAAMAVPNLAHAAVPASEARVLHRCGSVPDFAFAPRTHEELCQMHNLADFETAARVSGARFYFLKRQAAELCVLQSRLTPSEQALVTWATQVVAARGFERVLVPDLVRVAYADAAGFQPRSPASQMYSVADSDLCLVGTAEVSLAALHASRTYAPHELPLRQVGFSHCFRRETSHRGRLTRGLYRVHQFSKVEMFVVAAPSQSEQVLDELLHVQMALLDALQLPYRVLDMPAHDLGAPAARKYDIEVWLPSHGDYGEVTSASNCTDYQARRLHIRCGKEPAHTLNATALAVPRIIMALLENGQQADGSVRLPPVLGPYMASTHIGQN